MLADILQFGLGMFLIIGGIMSLWALTDRREDKKHKISERLRELEQWKAGEELREARERRLARETHIYQSELEADLNRGDAFDKAYKELLDGIE